MYVERTSTAHPLNESLQFLVCQETQLMQYLSSKLLGRIAPVSKRPADTLVTVYCCYELYAGSKPAALVAFEVEAITASSATSRRSTRRLWNNSLPLKLHMISLAVQLRTKLYKPLARLQLVKMVFELFLPSKRKAAVNGASSDR